ncbi:hypothetical protein ACLKA7_003297 [Drosophila subpalustris]
MLLLRWQAAKVGEGGAAAPAAGWLARIWSDLSAQRMTIKCNCNRRQIAARMPAQAKSSDAAERQKIISYVHIQVVQEALRHLRFDFGFFVCGIRLMRHVEKETFTTFEFGAR